MEEADIRGLLEHNDIAADTLVWRDGLSDWTEAQSTELFSGAESAPFIPIAPQPQPQRKHTRVSCFLFTLAETFNRPISGVIPFYQRMRTYLSDDRPGGVILSGRLSSMAVDDPEAAFEEVVSGLPKIAATILTLPAASRVIALQAAERSYCEMALGWGYPEMRAKRWAAVVMVALQRSIEDQTQNV
jgi:hypothetical protein